MLRVQNVELSLLKPWEDNPRINDEAVDAVAKSIESFGFNVPILCDQEFTIIAGHSKLHRRFSRDLRNFSSPRPRLSNPKRAVINIQRASLIRRMVSFLPCKPYRHAI
jgi:hypothetical protein